MKKSQPDQPGRDNPFLTEEEIESLREHGKQILTTLRGTFKDLFQEDGPPPANKKDRP
jgi:hypothetical protein